MDSDSRARLAGWFEQHAPALILYVRQWLERSSAEDVVQGLFVSLISLKKEPANLKAWLYRSARNGAISAARSEGRRRKREMDLARPDGSWFVAHPEDLIDAGAAEMAMNRLPAEQREVVVLRIWSDLTLAEIADVTGVSISTVHGRYQSGIAGIRTMMEESCQKK